MVHTIQSNFTWDDTGRHARLAVAPDGSRFIDSSGVVWDIESGAQHADLAETHVGVAWSSDGRWIACQYDDATTRIWNAETYKPVRDLANGAGLVWHMAFSPDNTLLAASVGEGTVRIWRVSTGELEAELDHAGVAYSLAWHPDGSRLMTGGRDQFVHVWDTATWDEVARLGGHTSYVYAMAFSPDGATLATTSGDSTVRLWKTHDNQR